MKEQEAIEKTIVQWTELAVTGGEKLDLIGVKDRCWLCQYGCEVTGKRCPTARCQPCPYYKKYGFCNKKGKPYFEWLSAESRPNKRTHANAFLAQIKTLRKDNMNKEQIEHKIDDYDKLVEEIQAKIEIMEKLKKEIQSQLAEAEEPKLRHGAWWWKEENPKNVRVFLKEMKDKKRDCVALVDGLLTTIGSAYRGEIIRGNIFTDLAALQETVTEFEMDAHTYRINTGEGWSHAPIHIAGNNHTLAEFHAFILKLRGLEAEYIRQQAGKGAAE